MNDQDLQQGIERFESLFGTEELEKLYMGGFGHGDVYDLGNIVVKIAPGPAELVSVEDIKEMLNEAGLKVDSDFDNSINPQNYLTNEFAIGCELYILGYPVPEMYCLKSYGERIAIFMEKIDGTENGIYSGKNAEILDDLENRAKEDGFEPGDVQALLERGTNRVVLFDFALWERNYE